MLENLISSINSGTVLQQGNIFAVRKVGKCFRLVFFIKRCLIASFLLSNVI